MNIRSGGAVTVNGNLIIANGCGNPIIDSRDGKTYNTVLIGTQCWFAQNLNVGTRINGSNDQTNNGLIEKYCYNDDENNCDVYGGLYQWAEMVKYINGATNTATWNPAPKGNVQGICPTGWHLPTDLEWTIFTEFLGGGDIAGGKMKETGLIHWSPINNYATNSSGFTALAGGFSRENGLFYNLMYTANFWSLSQDNNYFNNASHLILHNSNGSLGQMSNYKTFGFSIRCLKD